MIHPINIPEDLLSANPRRPQFFRPRPKVKISYGRDGRRIGPDGTALEPISPNTYWQDVFMRTFIRRLMPTTNENEPHLTDLTMPKGNNNISHVDIVDLSPSSSSSNEEKNPTFLAKHLEEENDGRRKDSQISTTSSNSNESSSSMPDRPSPNEFGASSTEEEEAAGDGLIQLGNMAMRQEEMANSQRISRKAIKTMLKECCQREGAEKMEEFARFDFSHLNLFGMANLEMENEVEGGLLELVPETKGSRVWTSRRQPRKVVHFEGESMEEEEKSIQFNIASVKIRPTKKVEIQLEAHNSLQNELQFQVETHLHKVEGQKIGECLRVQNQVERLKPGKETPIQVNIVLDGKMRKSLEKKDNEEQQFIMATMHGKVMS